VARNDVPTASSRLAAPDALATELPATELPATELPSQSSRAWVTAPGRLLSLLVRSLRGLLMAAVISSVLGGLGGALLVALIHQALAAPAAQLPSLGLQFAGASALMLVLRWLSKSQFVRLSQLSLAELRLQLAVHWAHAPYRDIENIGQDRLLSVLVGDVTAVSRFFVLLPRLVMQGAVIVGCLAYLAWQSWPAGMLTLVAVAVGSFGRHVATRRADALLERARAGEDALYAHFRGLFSGAKELALHRERRQAFVSSVIAGRVESVRRHATAAERWQVGAIHWGVAVSYLALGLIIFALSVSLQLSPEVRAGCALISLYMMLPVHALLGALPDIGRTRVALQRIQAVGVLGSPARLAQAAPRPAQPATPFSSLELCGVTHRYQRESAEESFLLGPIHLELRAGEIVFLVGGNGSGKSTLAKLLVGLYEPEAGELRLNGVPVTAETREAYRQSFSSVFSDFHLFESLLGIHPAELDARARRWLRALELEHVVGVEGGVLSSVRLSSGQRKRLALMVAALEDRPVCCFDEWAADQDPVYKRVFYEEVLPALAAQGRALLVITHDDHYFQLADRCLKLEAGQLLALPATNALGGPRRARAAWAHAAELASSGAEASARAAEQAR
jgi:putative ATP-binding cassette transporter